MTVQFPAAKSAPVGLPDTLLTVTPSELELPCALARRDAAAIAMITMAMRCTTRRLVAIIGANLVLELGRGDLGATVIHHREHDVFPGREGGKRRANTHRRAGKRVRKREIQNRGRRVVGTANLDASAPDDML